MSIKTCYFEKIYDDLSVPVIPFNHAWKSINGYLKYLVDVNLFIKPGNMVKFRDDLGRAVIVVNTRFGNVVLFNRHHDTPNIVVANAPDKVNVIVMNILSTSLSVNNVEKLLGLSHRDDCNIGKRIEVMSKYFHDGGYDKLGRLSHHGEVIDVLYKFVTITTIEYEVNGEKFTTHYKSLV